MQALADVTSIAHVIQLAVAPVFLLTGVGAILSVLVNRLGRVVDRSRVLEKLRPETQGEAAAKIAAEMSTLSRRARMIHWAIGFCTGCALLICVVIATLFVGSITGVDLSVVIAALFIGAMLSLVSGLICFLREIALTIARVNTLPR